MFRCTEFAWLWPIVRVWLGYNWVEASLSHNLGNPARSFLPTLRSRMPEPAMRRGSEGGSGPKTR